MANKDERNELQQICMALLKEMDGGDGGFSTDELEKSATIKVNFSELFFRMLEKMKWIIAVSIFVAVLSFAAATFLITPKYSATAKLYIINKSASILSLSDIQMGSYLTADYSEVFSNRTVHEQVKENLDLPYSVGQLMNMLEVSIPGNTRLIGITIKCENPQEAQDIANEYASVVRAFIAKTFDTNEPSLFEEAHYPSAPSSPNVVLITAAGFAATLLILSLIVLICLIVDDKIKTEEDIQRFADMSVFGVMPIVNTKRKGDPKKNYETRK